MPIRHSQASTVTNCSLQSVSPRSLLLVSHEARHEALRQFTASFQLGNSNPKIPINPDIDILYLAAHSNYITRSSLKNIKHLLIDCFYYGQRMDQESDQLAWIHLNHKAVEDMTILLYNNSPFYLRPQMANHLISFIEPQGVQHVTIKETMLQHVQQQLQLVLARKPDWLPPAVAAKVPIIVQ